MRVQAFHPKYVHYEDDMFLQAFSADMLRPGLVEHMNGAGHVLSRFEPARLPLAEAITQVLQDKDILPANLPDDFTLDYLHQWVSPELQAMDASQQSAVAIALYETGARFQDLYRRFIAEVVKPAVDAGPLYYQEVPTFRVFFPDAPGYPGKTTYHSDIMLGHPPREVNVWVPLANCAESRSMLLMDLDESNALHAAYDGDYLRFGVATQEDDRLIRFCETHCQPVTADYGEFVIFDSRCIHAGPFNKTDRTRISFDVRVLPARDYDAMPCAYQGIGRRQSRFVPGDYYASDPV